MSEVLVALLSKLAGLGTVAKAAVASAAAAVTVAAGVGTAAVLHSGGTSDAAEVAQGAVPPGDVGGPLADAGTTTVPTDTTVAPPTTVGRPSATTRASQSRASEASAPTVAAAAPTTAPTRTASAPTTASPVGVARRTPSDAEVQQAIDALPQYISTPITPTPGMVAEIGKQVCSAFDQGQTFAQVKTTGLRMLTQLPRTTVLPGGADWAVRTVVALYCPGHASKLV